MKTSAGVTDINHSLGSSSARPDDVPSVMKELTNTYDIYRDSPLRYLGYANELGESFRPLLPRLVVPSYALSFAYVAADTYDKASKSYVETKETKRAGMLALDTLVWQTLASILVPGFTINCVVRACTFGVKSWSATRPTAVRWFPTLAGLSVIPLIIHPIDHMVDYAMDRSIRRYY